MKNKVNFTTGLVTFITADGKIIEVNPNFLYTVFNQDTVSFILVGLPKSSGLSTFTSRAEDLEVDGATYTIQQLPEVLGEKLSESGAAFRWEIVETLPASGKSNTMYLVAHSDNPNVFDEYIWLADEQRWNLIGDTELESNTYLTKTAFNSYSAAVQTALENETSARTDADSALQTAINAEEAARISADTELSTSIANEAQRAQNAESGLSNDIASETSARTAADDALQAAINAEEAARISADTELSTSIANEAQRALNAESGLSDDIAAEASARTDADAALQSNIDIVSGNVATESARATSAEAALQTAIDNEVTARTAALDEVEEVIAAAVNDLHANKMDVSGMTAYTSTAVTDALNTVVTGHTADTTIHVTSAEKSTWNGKLDATAYTPSNFVASAEYVSSSTTIDFKNSDGTVISSIDATDFIKDGMVDNVEISGSNLVITFNTDSGKQDIQIPLTDIFDPSNYYTKSETSGATEISTALNAKQDTLSAGTNITISGNVISAEDNYISGVTVVDNSTPMPSVAQDKVKVIWADGYNATYDVDEGIIGDRIEHIYNNFVRLEFGNMTKDAHSNFIAGADDCYALSSVTFNGNIMFQTAPFGSAYLMEGIYFFADSPNVTLPNEEYSNFLTTVYDGCETYEFSAATYPIYVANLANYQNAVLYNDGNQNITWGQHFGNRLQQIPNGGKNVVFSYNTDKADITLPTSAITNGYATTAVTDALNTVLTGHTANTTVHVTSAEKSTWNAKQDVLSAGTNITISGNVISAAGGNNVIELTQAEYDALQTIDPDVFYIITDAPSVNLNNYYTKSETSGATEISTALAGKLDATAYTPTDLSNYYTKSETSGKTEISTALAGKLDATAYTPTDLSNYYTKSEVDSAITAATDDMATQTWVGNQGYLTQHQDISGKQDVSGMTAYTESSAFTAHTGDSTVHVTSNEKTSWDGAATNASNAVTALGGLKLVKLTQLEYDALTDKDADTLYIIS